LPARYANPYFSHNGAKAGFRNIFAAYDNAVEGAVVMTNGDNGSQLGDGLMHSIASEQHWPN